MSKREHVETRSLQLWPSGDGVQIRRPNQYSDEGMKVKLRDETRWHKPSAELLHRIKVEELAETYQQNMIFCCDSCLVDDLLKEGREGFNYDDIENLYTNPDAMDLDEIKDFLNDRNIEFADDAEEYELKGLVRANAEPAEIYEWYRVDGWLAKQLAKVGECVLDNDYGTWWGRCATGQQLIMDGTLQKVAENSLANRFA